MTVPISDVRVARSFIGVAAASSVESQEMDFNLGVREAIEIFAAMSTVGNVIVTATASILIDFVTQTLHMETETLDDVPHLQSEADEVDMDSEYFFRQAMHILHFNGTTEAAGGLAQLPSGLITFPVPILSAINITHRVETDTAVSAGCEVHVHYRYVALSTTEQAFQFARSRR